MVGYEQRVSFLIKFMVIVSTVNLSKFFMLRTKLCQSQPLRLWQRRQYGQRNGKGKGKGGDGDGDDDEDGDEAGIAFYGTVGRSVELFGQIEWRMDAFDIDIDTASLSVSCCLSVAPLPGASQPQPRRSAGVAFNSMWLWARMERKLTL